MSFSKSYILDWYEDAIGNSWRYEGNELIYFKEIKKFLDSKDSNEVDGKEDLFKCLYFTSGEEGYLNLIKMGYI